MQSGGEMAHFKWVGGSGRREKRKIQGLFLFFFILRPFTQKCPASFCQSRSPSKVHVPLLCRSKHSKWTFSHWSESTWQPQTHRPGLIHTDTAAAEKPSVLREQKPCLLAPFFRTLAKKKEGVHSLSALRWNVFWMEILDSSFSYSQLFCMLVFWKCEYSHGGRLLSCSPLQTPPHVWFTPRRCRWIILEVSCAFSAAARLNKCRWNNLFPFLKKRVCAFSLSDMWDSRLGSQKRCLVSFRAFSHM